MVEQIASITQDESYSTCLYKWFKDIYKSANLHLWSLGCKIYLRGIVSLRIYQLLMVKRRPIKLKTVRNIMNKISRVPNFDIFMLVKMNLLKVSMSTIIVCILRDFVGFKGGGYYSPQAFCRHTTVSISDLL